jgi:hypothetical protein
MATPHPALKKHVQFQSNNERHNTYNLSNRETDLAPKREFGKRCFNNLPNEAKIAECLKLFQIDIKTKIE